MLRAHARAKLEPTMLAAVAVSLVVILIIDLQTPLGYAEWVLYMVPVALTLLQPRTSWPYLTAATASVLSFVGWTQSPPGTDPTLAATNRVIGGIVLWALAAVVRQALTTRQTARRLLWLQQSGTTLAQRLLGLTAVEPIASAACASLCELLDAPTAVMYRLDGAVLRRVGGHALDAASVPETVAAGQGLTGQVAADGKLRFIADVPPGHLSLASGLGASTPRQLLIAPITEDGQLAGVVELGFAQADLLLDDAKALLADVADPIGTALRAAVQRQRLEALLEETQRQSEALQVQQEELRVANEELEEQSRALQESQARLETQQVDLEQSNVQLEERSELLERHRTQLLEAQQRLRSHAEQLEAASRYKSEFLANMSHELRTPLNSSLILAKLLADNREGTLSAEQVKYAQAIHASNNDLLVLINDILDLSKIEAGHVDLTPEPVALPAIVERLQAVFEPLAQQKALRLAINIEPGTEAALHTDGQRLQQILKNLLANALKFTERGEVTLRVRTPARGRTAFEVRDTGIGIPAHQQAIIFEAFRQADGSTSRRFGGTGLGLSIARELAQRLGGDIRVDSEPGRGSSFTLEIASRLDPSAQAQAREPGSASAAADHARRGREPEPAASASDAVGSLRAQEAERAGPAPWGAVPSGAPSAASGADLPPSPAVPRAAAARRDRTILAVEDDPRFAALLCQLAEELGFECVIAGSGAEAMRLARELQPSGILLDVGLPDESGLSVLERLKRDPTTRHLPVHMMSAHDRAQTALELGAVGYVMKPAAREELAGAISRLQDRLQRKLRNVLIVEDDPALRDSLGLLLRAEDVAITAVGSMADALTSLASSSFDCMVLDLSLPDGSGYELLETMAGGEKYAFPPVIVYTGRALDREEEARLRRYSKSIIVKGARSPERLLDEVTLFLHSVEASLAPEQQRMLAQARQRDSVLDGRRILLVEDDVRNIFALSSVFEPLGVKLEIARNGREAVERLTQGRGSDIDLVLMDIMMPEMDGLTAMKLLRADPALAKLPVIALTAKAMPEDREHCLEAGANDYVAKPIDIDKLTSLCRVWMPK